MEDEKDNKKGNLRIIKTNLYFILFFTLVWGIWHIIKTKVIFPNEPNTEIEIPSVYQHISLIDSNTLIYTNPEDQSEERFKSHKAAYSINDFQDIIYSHDEGLLFQFENNIIGSIIYGLVPDDDVTIRQTVYYKKSVEIIDGKALVPIKENLSGKYDIGNWEKNKKGTLGYRILDKDNSIIYTGSINFTGTGPFVPQASIDVGPFISSVTDTSAIIWFTCTQDCQSDIQINDIQYSKQGKRHAYLIKKLKADSVYPYTINVNDFSYRGELTTAPSADSDKAFSFAFTSDSRAGLNLGEYNIYGHNAYIMKKVAVITKYLGASFFQFTGDLINGYEDEIGSLDLQYHNWFKTLSPFFHSTPINVGFGNHESFVMTDYPLSVDAFPFDKQSGETHFANWVENPMNGPNSEDGSILDPSNEDIDFPTYKENVYSYKHGNTAFIVLNSNYLYTPSAELALKVGGNIHGYIMDQQLSWLENRIDLYEKDSLMKHVFVTIHTPAFPIGGHAKNDMWYLGENKYRPVIAGKVAEKGIIERRDEFLNILINKSSKVRALLTGDEHNYSRMILNDSTPIYPVNWKHEKLKVSRPLVQIVNGSAGAPYYGREDIPWYSDVRKFSSQNAVVFFHIEGDKIQLEVINPDTYETIEKLDFY